MTGDPTQRPDDPRPTAAPAEDREFARIRTAMHLATWVALLAFMAFLANNYLEKRYNPNQEVETRYADGVAEVTLQRNRQGHYVTSGEINGERVTFMLDTGATGVAVPAGLAADLRLERGPARPVRTANGVTTSYATRLDRVSIGGIVLGDVRADIVPGLDGDEVLLGMSFLKHIEFTQRGSTLTLRQHR